MSSDAPAQTPDRFPQTRLSVLEAARNGDVAKRQGALDTLFAAYWKPVYKYVRLRWNHPIEDAQDLTQGFFVELLERELLLRYDPRKSRLRTYLRVCVDSFVLNEGQAAHRQKRGGYAPHVALDFAAAEGELRDVQMDIASTAASDSPEHYLETEWIRSLFTLSVEDLRNRCEARGRPKTFQIFEEYDLGEADNISYQALASKYALPVTDVTNALAWARREFRSITLGRLREICGSDQEYRSEVIAIFGK
jgi:hypothetical protein